MTKPGTMGKPHISTWCGELRSQSNNRELEAEQCPLSLSYLPPPWVMCGGKTDKPPSERAAWKPGFD